jgi:hypothetical protein
MTTCMACGEVLKPGFDYPREKAEVFTGTEVGPDTPILCWEPNGCIERALGKAKKEGYSLG